MRKLAIALLILVASAAYANKAKTAADYAGSYRGPSESYGLVLEITDGKLTGNYVELGRVAVLGPIQIDGSEFTATASFDDGSWRTIKGSFATRVLNGRSTFGLSVEDVFFERMS